MRHGGSVESATYVATLWTPLMQVRLRAHRARGVGVHHAVGDDRALLRHHVPPQEAQPQALAHSLIRLGGSPLQPPEVLRIKVWSPLDQTIPFFPLDIS